VANLAQAVQAAATGQNVQLAYVDQGLHRGKSGGSRRIPFI
jgi:hypothetical protein